MEMRKVEEKEKEEEERNGRGARVKEEGGGE